MTRKIVCILLAILLLSSLTACGSTSGSETETQSPSVSTPAETTEEAKAAQTQEQVVFEEVVLVDNENCTFKITAIEEDNFWGYTLKAYLENKTDKELMFSLDSVSVNGVMCDPFWAATVTAGMKSNEDISFLSTTLEESGVAAVTVIEFTLNVRDANDYTSEHLISEVFTIYPMGEDTVQLYQRTPVEGEIVLFDNEYASIIITGVDEDNLLGYTLTVYLENKTDKDLMFSTSDVAVNGFMCDPFWATKVAAGKCSNTTISWFSDDFAENSITDVESIVMHISVYDANNWLADYLVDETFTVNPDF